jgi:hypothetical protein
MIPKGSAQEYNHDGQGGEARPNEAGVYFHPQAQKFVETAGVKRPDGSIAYAQGAGKIQGDAFTQIGYRPATDEELKEYRAQQKERAEAQRLKDSRKTTAMSSQSRK